MPQSYVHLVFRDEKDPRTECEHWQYWHSQQPNPQQRAFDIGKIMLEMHILQTLAMSSVKHCCLGSCLGSCQRHFLITKMATKTVATMASKFVPWWNYSGYREIYRNICGPSLHTALIHVLHTRQIIMNLCLARKYSLALNQMRQ